MSRLTAQTAVTTLGVVASIGVGAWAALGGTATALPAPASSARMIAKATSFFGFSQPYAGNPRYVPVAPREIASARQLNRPLGQRLADRIARDIGLRKADTLTTSQYRALITGKGVGGSISAAKLIDASVLILTNTKGHPRIANVNGHPTPFVLASYGLWVNKQGLLESPANTTAPTREINSLLVPGGYIGTWFRANGAAKSLVRLYRSAYSSEVVYGNRSQNDAGVAQLLTNTKDGHTVTVGMSMAPSIWIVNFALIYTLNPSLAANMPRAWAAIPAPVAQAISASPTGQVPYSEWKSYLS